MYYDKKLGSKSNKSQYKLLLIGSIILFFFTPVMIVTFHVEGLDDLFSTLVRAFSTVASIFIFISAIKGLKNAHQ